MLIDYASEMAIKLMLLRNDGLVLEQKAHGEPCPATAPLRHHRCTSPWSSIAGHYWDSNDYSTDPWLVVMQLSCSVWKIQLVIAAYPRHIW